MGDCAIRTIGTQAGSAAIPVSRSSRRQSPSRFPSLATISIAALLSCSAPAPREWNVLLITIDTLRADHLSCYGYERSTSPTLDALAAEGVLFEQAIAQRSQTWPSLTSIMTSLYPHEHGVRRNGQRLDGPVLSLAEVMKTHGYRTGASLTNMRQAEHPGFEETFFFKGDDRDLEATKAAIDWLEGVGNEKYFFWLHYIAPHKPYRPPTPFDRLFGEPYTGKLGGERETLDQITLDKVDLAAEDLAHVIALYDGEIAFVDDQIQKVLEALESAKLAPRTLIVLTADHGEELFQRNHYFYHSNSIYDSVLHIPWIVRLPDPSAAKAGRRVARVVESIDFAPTILGLLGLPIPDAYRGESHAALILGDEGAPDEEPAAFSELPWGVMSIRTASWRYVSNPQGSFSRERPYGLVEDARRDGYAIGRQELYDHRNDPGELNELLTSGSGDARSATRRLKERLATWSVGWTPATAQTEIDPRALEELRALGYVE